MNKCQLFITAVVASITWVGICWYTPVWIAFALFTFAWGTTCYFYADLVFCARTRRMQREACRERMRRAFIKRQAARVRGGPS